MKRSLIAIIAACTFSTPAFAVGECQKPETVKVPEDVAQLSAEEFAQIHENGDVYLQNAKSYLSCLDQIIYSNAPENPIVSEAGKAHEQYGQEWTKVWGELNLACSDWEAAHDGAQFPGGCLPFNPASS